MTNEMLEDLPRPVIFAHRGASKQAPENTMAAFELAQHEGAPAIELDTKLTRDGKIVVLHDPRVDRTTDGKGKVAEMTAEEVRALDAGRHFSDEYRGQRIPLLEEVFEALGRKMLINVEIRNYWTPHDGLADRVCELVKRHGLQGQVMFSSFYAPNLKRTRQVLPQVPRGLLTLRGWKGLWARSFGFSLGDYEALHPHVSDVKPQQIQRAHRLQRRVHVWTVNDPTDILRLAEWRADGIITDEPGAALQVLGLKP